MRHNAHAQPCSNMVRIFNTNQSMDAIILLLEYDMYFAISYQQIYIIPLFI